MSAPAIEGYRRRLLDGLALSINERGYRETTVADVVRSARTSKRTFYDHFSTKEECFAELLAANPSSPTSPASRPTRRSR